MRTGKTVLLLALAACSGGGRPQDEAEQRVTPLAASIVFLGLDLPASGAVLGGHYGGNNTSVRQSTYQLSDGLRARWTQESREHGEALLRGSGFQVRAVGPSSSDVRQLFGVQYGLSGLVHQISVRTTGEMAPLRVEVHVDVGWELLDLGSGGAVFGRRVEGIARASGEIESAVGAALDDALTSLLTDQAFHTAVAMPRSDPDVDHMVGYTRTLPGPGETFRIALDDRLPSVDSGPVGRIAAGLVTIYGGDRSYGTAFLLTRDGIAVAGAREVHNSDRLRARLPSGVDRPVRLLRSSGRLDIALLQVACPGECVTVDWEAPGEVPVYTNVMAVGAPIRQGGQVSVTTGRVGGRWGIAHGVTLEGMGEVVAGGEPVGRTATGRVFGVISVRRGRRVVLLLDEVFRSLNVQVLPATQSRN